MMTRSSDQRSTKFDLIDKCMNLAYILFTLKKECRIKRLAKESDSNREKQSQESEV